MNVIRFPTTKGALTWRWLTVAHRCYHRKKGSSATYDHLVVIDFEATCDGPGTSPLIQEIIEFPALKVDTSTWRVVSSFHRFVRPVQQPLLTPFCTRLTGIIQETVDQADTFDRVLAQFHHWLEEQPAGTWAAVTCGDWDLRFALPHQCQLSGLTVPEGLRRWIDVKKAHAEATGVFPRNLPHLMELMGLKHEGRLHSGFDDCLNIAKVLVAMAERRYRLRLVR